MPENWAYTLARIPAGRAASFLYLVPAVSLGIAWLWLGEWPTWLALLGGAVAISGVVIVNLFGKNNSHAKTQRRKDKRENVTIRKDHQGHQDRPFEQELTEETEGNPA